MKAISAIKDSSVLKNIREYENLHIALWLVKDACWVMDIKVAGMLMIIPTMFVALHLTWKSKNNTSDLFHNIAVCLWISANATWMTGEFFYNDTLRPFAVVFFAGGIVSVTLYYIVHFPKKKREDSVQHNLMEKKKQAA